MKTIFLVLSLIVNQSDYAELSTIYEVLKHVESNNNPKAIGDTGNAFGVVQIHKACVEDVNRVYGTQYYHEQMFDEQCASEVFYLYLRYGIKLFKIRNKAKPTTQDVVRMWNGGIYSGYRRESTKKYYKKYLQFKTKLNKL